MKLVTLAKYVVLLDVSLSKNPLKIDEVIFTVPLPLKTAFAPHCGPVLIMEEVIMPTKFLKLPEPNKDDVSGVTVKDLLLIRKLVKEEPNLTVPVKLPVLILPLTVETVGKLKLPLR